MRLHALHWLVPIFFLAGCTIPPVPAPSVCPPVQEYTLDQQKQAQSEYLALPANSMLRRFIDDYGVERKRLRRCRDHAN